MSDDQTKPNSITYDDIVAVTNNIAVNNPVSGWFSVPSYWYWENPPDPLPPKETVIGYVEAWRWWPIKAIDVKNYGADWFYAYNFEGILRSVEYIREYYPTAENFTNRIWSWSAENVADEPPSFNNANGFYAYNLEGIEDHEACQLFGRVALYGDVIHCKYGYRAEKARILDVWVDKDYTRDHPEAWSELEKIPQVKGIFDTSDPFLYNSRGEKENYQCLTLEHQKELSGTSLSDGPTTSPRSNQTMLVIDRKSRIRIQKRWNPSRIPFTYAPQKVSRDVTIGLDVLPGSGREPIVVRPEGGRCGLCDGLIGKDDAVTVSLELPDDYMQRIFDRTFEWNRKRNHLECMAASMAPCPITGANWDDLDSSMYPTYGGITRSAPTAIHLSEVGTLTSDEIAEELDTILDVKDDNQP